MNEFQTEIDDDELLSKLSNIEPRQLEKIFRKGLMAGANIIKSQARTNLRSVTTASKSEHANLIHGWNLNKKGKSAKLEEGIQTKYHKDYTGNNPYAKVNIMKDFRLRFFNNGTIIRGYKTKKGMIHNTGNMIATNFFNNAINSTSDKANKKMEEVFLKGINDNWKK